MHECTWRFQLHQQSKSIVLPYSCQDSKLFSSLIALPKGVLERPKLLDYGASLYTTLNMTAPVSSWHMAQIQCMAHTSQKQRDYSISYLFLQVPSHQSSSKEPGPFADLRISLGHKSIHVALNSCLVSETVLN